MAHLKAQNGNTYTVNVNHVQVVTNGAVFDVAIEFDGDADLLKEFAVHHRTRYEFDPPLQQSGMPPVDKIVITSGLVGTNQSPTFTAKATS